MFDSETFIFGGLILVGAVWGITNPFIEQGTKQDKFEPFNFSWKSFLQLFLRLKVMIPFIINQLGSALFYFLLGKTPIILGPAVANSSSTVFTLITEYILKGKKFTIKILLGISLVITGITLCLTAK